MIPTRSKTKIPQGWSYPVGAEVVSKALEGIPQYENIYLRFLWMNPTSRLISKDKSRIHILGVSYANPQRIAIKENWGFDLSAVPSGLKALIHDYLVKEALHSMRDWMTLSRTSSWYESHKYISVSYNVNTEQFEHRESGRI